MSGIETLPTNFNSWNCGVKISGTLTCQNLDKCLKYSSSKSKLNEFELDLDIMILYLHMTVSFGCQVLKKILWTRSVIPPLWCIADEHLTCCILCWLVLKPEPKATVPLFFIQNITIIQYQYLSQHRSAKNSLSNSKTCHADAFFCQLGGINGYNDLTCPN